MKYEEQVKKIYQAYKIGPLELTISDEVFVDREDTADLLFKLAKRARLRDAISVVFHGPRRLGKTELLKRFYNVLFWTQDELVPIYFQMEKEHLEHAKFGDAYFKNFILQYIAFRNKDPSLLKPRIETEELIKIVERSKDEYLYTNLMSHIRCVKNNDVTALIDGAIHTPRYVARHNDTPILIMFDEFQRVDEMTLNGKPFPYSGAFQSAVEVASTTYIMSGSSMTLLNKTLSQDQFFMRFRWLKLGALKLPDCADLVWKLCKYHGIEINEKMVTAIIFRCKGNPFYVKCLIEQAVDQEMDLDSDKNIQEVISIESSSGYIWHDWESRFREYFSGMETITLKNGIKVPELEFARYVIYNALQYKGKIIKIADMELIADKLNSKLEDVRNILQKFEYGDFLENVNGYYSILNDPFLQDYIETQFKLLVENVSIGEIQGNLRRKVYSEIGKCNKMIGKFFEKSLEDLLYRWNDTDSIPAILFDYEKYNSLSEEDLQKELENPKNTIKLTKMKRVTKNYFIQVEEGKPAKEIDVIGFGEQKQIWIVDSRFREDRINDKHIEELLQKAIVFQENNPNEEIKVWCVSKSGFTKEALLLANENGIYTTGLEQLNYFFRRFVLGVI